MIHLKEVIRNGLVRRLGGVPFHEFASVDHRRQRLAMDLTKAENEVLRLSEANTTLDWSLGLAVEAAGGHEAVAGWHKAQNEAHRINENIDDGFGL